MGIIRNALVGIALYEVVSYLLKKGSDGSLDSRKSFTGAFSGVQTPSISSLNVTDVQRSKLKERVSSDLGSGSNLESGSNSNLNTGSNSDSSLGSSSNLNKGSNSSSNSDFDLAAGSNPELPLSGDGSVNPPKDEWTNSLANDELRAPDS